MPEKKTTRTRKEPFDIDVVQIDRFAKRLSTTMECRSLKALRLGESADPEGEAYRNAYKSLEVVASYLGVELDAQLAPADPEPSDA